MKKIVLLFILPIIFLSCANNDILVKYKLPVQYTERNRLHPVNYVVDLKLKEKEKSEEDVLLSICKLIIFCDKAAVEKYGSSGMINSKCDVVEWLLLLDNSLSDKFVDGSMELFFSDVVLAAEVILKNLTEKNK